MTFKEAVRRIFHLLVCVSGIWESDGWGGPYQETSICALKGTTVMIKCRLDTNGLKVNQHDAADEHTFWFRKQQDNQPVDLRTNWTYVGRVQYTRSRNEFTLSISDLRESDAAVYMCGLITSQGHEVTRGSAVTLTVTDLQVKCTYWRCTCYSSCQPPSYIWYKNGRQESEKSQTIYWLSDEDTISCAVPGFEEFQSPLVCVKENECKKVAFIERSICTFPGSSVNISGNYSSYSSSTFKYYFVKKTQQNRYIPGKGYSRSYTQDRLQLLDHTSTKGKNGNFTLKIGAVTKEDSGQYVFEYSGRTFPGTTLTVKDPDIKVEIIWTSTGTVLVCQSSCPAPDHLSFTWYKNDNIIAGETSPVLKGYDWSQGSYSCGFREHLSSPVYAPKIPTVNRYPLVEIVEGGSMSLSCLSEANPTATYSWHREKQRLVSTQATLYWTVKSSDSGDYYCTAKNELGKTVSQLVSIDVKYGPKFSVLLVSPSGELQEGSSVTLTCSTDAKPTPSYIWYKGDKVLQKGPVDFYPFPSISSKDSGVYKCLTENHLAQMMSQPEILDIKTAPKRPIVSVTPPGQIMKGSSVTLTCRSDANPAAKYTWYKKNTVISTGQNFTINNITTEHGGEYQCEVQNRFGKESAAITVTLVSGAWKVAATTTGVLLAFVLLAVILYIRKNNLSQVPAFCCPWQKKKGKRRADVDQRSSEAQSERAEQQDELFYSTICFSNNEKNNLYSNIRFRKEEEEEVEYSVIEQARPDPQDQEDTSALYAKVNYKARTIIS